jgi:exodeoxyribonuclease VII small subunit
MSKPKGAETIEDKRDEPFEEAVEKLESIVESMEAQDLPLETLLAKYEEGARLARLCEAKLNDADLKIQQLERTAKGDYTLKPAAVESGARDPNVPNAE